MKSLALEAPAKVNLFLKVGPRRRDGFHTLLTEFQEISLRDSLRFQVLESPVLHLTVSGASLPVNSKNLVIRALAALRLRLHVRQGMRVHLTKRIPLGAGLGGGSSDAAAALWGGWFLWKKKPASSYRRRVPPVLIELAAKLGADVAFFLRGGRALGRGKGDVLTPLPARSQRWMVVVHPRVHVSTIQAYGWLDRDRGRKNRGEIRWNDFEPPVFKRCPAVARVRKELVKLGCRDVMMSGSGSAVFGFVSSAAAGKKIQWALKKRRWDSWVVHT